MHKGPPTRNDQVKVRTAFFIKAFMKTWKYY